MFASDKYQIFWFCRFVWIASDVLFAEICSAVQGFGWGGSVCGRCNCVACGNNRFVLYRFGYFGDFSVEEILKVINITEKEIL